MRGRRNHPVDEGRGGGDHLERARGTHQMTVERFRRRYGDAPRVVAEHLLDRIRFDNVTHGRRGAVRVDVTNLARCNLRLCERGTHRSRLSVRVGFGDVARVGGIAIPDELRVDARASAFRALRALEHERRRAFTEHDAAAIPRERFATPRRIDRIGVRERLHRIPRAQVAVRDERLGAAGDDDVGVSTLDSAVRFADARGG